MSTPFPAWLDTSLRALVTIGRDDLYSVAEASYDHPDAHTARTAFARRAPLLLAPNTWGRLSGVENADFQHFCPQGERILGITQACVGDFIRVALPLASIERHDWVRVEAMAASPDRVFLQVRPSEDPTLHPRVPELVAHFFAPTALNTLMLTLDGLSLRAQVIGEHECANTGPHAGDVGSALRNRLAAEAGWGLRGLDGAAAGSLDGPQQYQWKRFTANLVGVNG